MLITVLSSWWYFKQQHDHLFYFTFFCTFFFPSCFDEEGNGLKWIKKKTIKYIYFWWLKQLRREHIRHEGWGGALVGLWASWCDPSWWMYPDGEEWQGTQFRSSRLTGLLRVLDMRAVRVGRKMIIDCGNGAFFLFLMGARDIQSPQESQISLKGLGEPRDWG